MSKREILHTRYGEMMDLLACSSVYNGDVKVKKKKLTYDEVMNLR